MDCLVDGMVTFSLFCTLNIFWSYFMFCENLESFALNFRNELYKLFDKLPRVEKTSFITKLLKNVLKLRVACMRF